jgi:acyl carrier protein
MPSRGTRVAYPYLTRVTSVAMESLGISAALQSILRDDLQVDVSRITADSHLIDDLGLDSVAFAVGMVAIEENLGVALSEEDLLTCNTVGDLDRAIQEKVNT